MKYEENHIFNKFTTFQEYRENEYLDGSVMCDDELYFDEEDFIAYKKLQRKHENDISKAQISQQRR